ncbi:helix-turn-helix domain-containing protein [uncultured Sphingomonas sp.]|uniref:helix-turn-helix domain-containing protein n=1 Tax=uncultured Sphingomonas sp. TaxID=158754 RepID=UPI0025F7496A|nr:helix-turn-helix domain-containing protein [uncultured Sphingomonas sp.]
MSAAGYRFSTAGRQSHDAFDQYHSIFAAGAEATRHADAFEAELTGFEFTRMVVHRRRLVGVRHVRDAAQVRRTDFSHFTLTLCLSGTVAAVVDENERVLLPGEILLCDMTRSGVIQIDGAETITAAVAREVVEAAGGEPRRFNGLILDRARAAPLARHLTALTHPPLLETPTGSPEEEVADRLRDILAGQATAAAQRARARRLLGAHRIIEARLDDPTFDASELASALRMSRATLYRVFEPLGGVAAHLLDRRLTRLRRLLANGRGSALAPLVARVGLVSDSHASRVFLDRFGERPGRFATRNREISDAQRAAQAMVIWTGLLA